MLTFIVIAVVSFAAGGLFFGFLVYGRQQHNVHEWQTKFEVLQGMSEAQKNLIANQKDDTENLKKQMAMQFENLAQKIFDEKTSRFSDQNYKQLSGMLDPLKERIKDFEKKVDDTYSQERYERGHLKGEISKLIELNTTMSKEAQNLVLALKGENKTQGNWGEMILENILDRCGLRKGQEYTTQETLYGESGEILRPDVIVKLPDGKSLIVDSKMTLTAYEAYSSTNDLVEKEKFATQHVESLKRHVQELAGKKYHSADKMDSPDFVMLFMPLEPAFALAFQRKPEIFDQSWTRNIAIVSPTTLLATLRTVASLWKLDRQQKNAVDIAKAGGSLYDKFVGIVTDLDQLGKRLRSATETHEQVMGKISTGKGNLITQVEKLKELGAKTEKSLPQITE